MSEERPFRRQIPTQHLTLDVDAQPIESQTLRDQLDQVLSGDRERDTRNVALLLETVRGYDSSGDLAEYLDRVVDMVVEMTGADRGILLLRKDEDEPEVVAARDSDRQTIEQLTQFSQSIPAQVLENGEPVCVVDTLQENMPTVGKSVEALSLKTVMCVPLMGQREIMGVMYVDSRFKNRKFHEADLGFFEAICNQAAMAIHQARLTEYVMETRGLAAVGGVAKRLIGEITSPAKDLQRSAAKLRKMELKPEGVKRVGAEVDSFLEHIFNMLNSAQDYALVAEPQQRERVDAESFVRGVLDRCAQRLRLGHVELLFEAEESVDIEVDTSQLERAICALVDNAVEAMPEGGELTVRVADLGFGGVDIRIADTGGGAAADDLDGLFEPFSSHGKTHHLGLGLATVRSIVQRHGGMVSAEPVEPQGLAVTIVLPPAVPS